jgi:hypothetical protein
MSGDVLTLVLPDGDPAAMPGPGVAAPAPYRRGWRAPWRGQWGGFNDGNTKLARLACRIERELREVYLVEAAIEHRRVRQAARLMALSEQTMHTMGSDPKSTRRAATSLAIVAEGVLASLQRRAARPAPTNGAELLEQLDGDGKGGGLPRRSIVDRTRPRNSASPQTGATLSGLT